MPYIMSGIRIAAVSSVGTMTIAAFAGANGLGSFIQLGMNSLNYPMTIMGAVAAALMALTLDFLLGRVERAFTSEGLLPQDQIKNLSLSVRSRRKAMAAALCGACWWFLWHPTPLSSHESSVRQIRYLNHINTPF